MKPAQKAAVSAALRHIRDAEALLPASPDQSWHLAGFGPECIRKACLVDRMFDKVLGHDWGTASEEMLEIALSLDPHAARYHLSGWTTAEPVLGRWRPSHRYDRTGAHAHESAALVQAAGRLVGQVHAQLWMDGALTQVEDR
jgi:hypothetical protein